MDGTAPDLFPLADQIVAGIEAGFSVDPTDPGNWTGGEPNAGTLKGTKYGISAKAYPDLDIANLTLDQAQAIRRRDYWDLHRCGEMPWPWALGVYDGEINQGSVIELAQLVAGLRQVDGVVGSATLAALAQAAPDAFDEFMALRGVRYTHLTALFPRDGKGWLKRLMRIARAAAAPPGT